MATQKELLKQLGFSTQLLQSIEENSFENYFHTERYDYIDSIDVQSNDLNNIHIQKSEEPFSMVYNVK